jgi:hypothetical protein
MALRLEMWREWQEHDARRRAAVAVASAVSCYKWNRQPFYDLHVNTGLQVSGGETLMQRAVHLALAEVCD